MRLIDADRMAVDELAAFISAEPQPDDIQVRTVDDLGRICIPKDIRDKLGIKPGTECAVYSTDELASDEIIVIRRKKNESIKSI